MSNETVISLKTATVFIKCLSSGGQLMKSFSHFFDTLHCYNSEGNNFLLHSCFHLTAPALPHILQINYKNMCDVYRVIHHVL